MPLKAAPGTKPRCTLPYKILLSLPPIISPSFLHFQYEGCAEGDEDEVGVPYCQPGGEDFLMAEGFSDQEQAVVAET